MIEFRNVSKVYNNGTEALHNINLKVEKGEFVFIVGSSGAGKSTFLKLITCEERPNEGQVLIDGQDISHIRKGKIPYVRRKMGLVFQDFRLIDHMTVYDNVAFAMRVVGAGKATCAASPGHHHAAPGGNVPSKRPHHGRAACRPLADRACLCTDVPRYHRAKGRGHNYRSAER